MKKVTSLFLTLAVFFSGIASAQLPAEALQRRAEAGNSIFKTVLKTKFQNNSTTTARAKKATQKKLATYTYVDRNEQTNTITDTSEKFTLTWGGNGIPTEIRSEGISEDFIEGKEVPFRLVYTDFVRVNPMVGNEFDYFYEDADFDAKKGILQVYENNSWMNYAKLDKTISAEGLPQEVLVQMWDNNTWINGNKETFTYNAAGYRTESLEQEWDGTKWMNFARRNELRDSKGRSTGYIDEVWNNTGNKWDIDYGYKLLLTENSTGQVLTAEPQFYSTDDKQWTSFMRQSYEYNGAGEIEVATMSSNQNGNWMKIMQYKNIEWKKFDETMTFGDPLLIGGSDYNEMDTYYYVQSDDSWLLGYKMVNVYTGNNLTTNARLSWDDNSATWDTTSKSTTTYYPNGDMKERTDWDKFGSNWAVRSAYGVRNTYDMDGDLLTSTGLDWDDENNVMVEEDMEIFTYANVTVGIENMSLAKKATFNVYPNPASNGVINIALSSPANKMVYVTVYDNVGKLIMQKSVNNANQNITLDINNLPKGLYIMNVNEAGKINKARFVVQ